MALVECLTRGYFTNQNSIGFQLNAIQMQGDITAEMTITFPNPWLILGFALAVDTDSDPTIPAADINVAPDATQIAYVALPQLLSIAFMEANQADPSNALSTEYTDGLFWKYFFKFLNADLKPENYNTFLWPLGAIKAFWSEENALPAPYREQAIYNFVKSLCDTSNKRLWGAPGTYTIRAQDGIYRFWDRCFQWQVAVGDNLEVVANWFNPPTIPLDASTESYIAVVGDGGGPVMWGSLTVPYAGIGPANPVWPADPTDANAVATAILNWITAVMTAETGDAPEPFANYPATLATYTLAITNVPVDPFCFGDAGAGIQISLAANQNYDFGTLALAPGMKGIMAIFNYPYAVQPYWGALAAYVAEFEALPLFAVIEQKSIE